MSSSATAYEVFNEASENLRSGQPLIVHLGFGLWVGKRFLDDFLGGSCELVRAKTRLANAFIHLIAVYGNIAGSFDTNADDPYFNRDSRTLAVGGHDSRSSTAQLADVMRL